MTPKDYVDSLSYNDVRALAEFGLETATLLGSHEEWPGAYMLESIGQCYTKSVKESGPLIPPHIGDAATTSRWRRIADKFGIEHDGDYGRIDHLTGNQALLEQITNLSHDLICDGDHSNDALWSGEYARGQAELIRDMLVWNTEAPGQDQILDHIREEGRCV